MPNLIEQRVELARRGETPFIICRLASGWLVTGDVQPLPGYCLLLADPVVESTNALDASKRSEYSLDVVTVGDALLAVTDAYRINYETLCNSEPALHAHIIPRYRESPSRSAVRSPGKHTTGRLPGGSIPSSMGPLSSAWAAI